MEHNEKAWPAEEMERIMKVQEVIMKVIAGKLKWVEAAALGFHPWIALYSALVPINVAALGLFLNRTFHVL